MSLLRLSTLGLLLTGCAPGGSAPAPAPAVPDPVAAVEIDPALGPGTLRFHPDRPAVGESVEVVYRAIGSLEGQPVLQLRARVRTPDDESYNGGMGSRTVALLHRESDGCYRGRMTLPEEAVYAAIAVEDTSAASVDSREGRFWELLVHDSDGRPLFAAIEQRFNDHMGRDELAVLESARRLVRLYPGHPRSWTMLRAAEGWVLGEDGEEERTARHRERLVAFDRQFRGEADLSADPTGYLYWYARLLGDEELTTRWRERLASRHPDHFFAVQDRTLEILRAHADDPVARLEALETVWAIANGRQARSRVLGRAFSAARETGDSATISTWITRYTQLYPGSSGSVARTLAADSTTPVAIRDAAIRRLESGISAEEQAPDGDRPLGATAAEHQRAAAGRAAGLRTALGTALLAAGRTSEGIATLERAADADWNVARLRTLGDARRKVGDDEGVLRAYSAVAADPATSVETGDSLRIVAGVAPDAWAEAVDRARDEMVRTTLRSARSDAIESATLTLRGGRQAALDELLGEQATVVVRWSRYCGYSVQAMPAIADLAARLARTDGAVRLIAVTRDSPADAEPYLEEGGWPIGVAFDSNGEVARALNSWGTPQYFVLDGDGRLRYAFSSLDDLPRQLMALTGRAGG